MSRFDYVQYDQKAQVIQKGFKDAFESLAAGVENPQMLQDPHMRDLAIMKLEEAYMWIGKGIRNDQIRRNFAAKLREDRAPYSCSPEEA